MAKGRGLIICVSVAYIILGASMAFCGAFQIILHLRYLWLDSVYAGVWVGMWMIVTGIMGIISSFNKCATYFIFVFMIFSFISTLLGLEIVSYYTYTGAAHWSVYLSSRNYLIIASVTCFFAIVEIITGICALYFSYVLRRNVRRIAAQNASAQAAPGNDAGQAASGNDAGQAAPGNVAGQAAPGNDAGQVEAGNDAGQAAPGNDAGQVEPGNDARQAEVWFLDRPWNELPREAIREHQNSLGKGHFGVVNRGEVQIDGEWIPCAIKRVLNAENARLSGGRNAVLEELKIMVTVGEHPNIINLIGACTTVEPILIVVRLAENGNLEEYLTRSQGNPISTKDKIKIARDVANGMLHLSSKRCVHRDLAARNVLLGKDNVAMVSDFGLSRDVYESGEYERIDRQRPLPIRWMAIECLNGFPSTTESDVWSFGVLMWEIESGGAKPYPTMGNVLEIKDFLNNGRRLTKPHGCLPEIHEIMKKCWEKEPSKRPTFRELSTSLEELLAKSTEASDPVINTGQGSEDRMAAHGDQLPMYQRSQASGASSNRPAPVNDAGPAHVSC